MVKVGQASREAILECLLDTRVCSFEALEHIQVLLPVLKVLGQQAKGFEMLELPGPEKAEDEGIICAEKTNVRPGDHHVSDLLDVLVQRVWVFIQFQPSFLQGLRGQACLQMSHCDTPSNLLPIGSKSQTLMYFPFFQKEGPSLSRIQ